MHFSYRLSEGLFNVEIIKGKGMIQESLEKYIPGRIEVIYDNKSNE